MDHLASIDLAEVESFFKETGSVSIDPDEFILARMQQALKFIILIAPILKTLAEQFPAELILGPELAKTAGLTGRTYYEVLETILPTNVKKTADGVVADRNNYYKEIEAAVKQYCDSRTASPLIRALYQQGHNLVAQAIGSLHQLQDEDKERAHRVEGYEPAVKELLTCMFKSPFANYFLAARITHYVSYLSELSNKLNTLDQQVCGCLLEYYQDKAGSAGAKEAALKLITSLGSDKKEITNQFEATLTRINNDLSKMRDSNPTSAADAATTSAATPWRDGAAEAANPSKFRYDAPRF